MSHTRFLRIALPAIAIPVLIVLFLPNPDEPEPKIYFTAEHAENTSLLSSLRFLSWKSWGVTL